MIKVPVLSLEKSNFNKHKLHDREPVILRTLDLTFVEVLAPCFALVS